MRSSRWRDVNHPVAEFVYKVLGDAVKSSQPAPKSVFPSRQASGRVEIVVLQDWGRRMVDIVTTIPIVFTRICTCDRGESQFVWVTQNQMSPKDLFVKN